MVMNTSEQPFIQTPFGHVAIGKHDGQLYLRLSNTTIEGNPVNTFADKSLSQMYAALQLYFQSPFNAYDDSFIDFATLKGTDFQRRVWQAIADIPAGNTCTYGTLAKQLNSGPRAVANACGANHLPILIPCHRVVASQSIGGFMRDQSGGLAIKRWLLDFEGAKHA